MSDRYSIDNSRIINVAQIVQAVYDPADEGIDDETGRPYKHTSKCVITLTSVHLEERGDFDGNVTGTASASDTVTLRDKWADRFWTAYQRDAYAV